jgi:alanine racemase
MAYLRKRTWAEISLDNLRHNYFAIRSAIPASCRFLGVVKADAYGHGATQVASMLEKCGADYLAVSCLDEAMELRDNGIRLPVLILGYTPSEYTAELIENNITQTVTCLEKAEEYSAAASALGRKLRVHIKVDSGMSRLGFLCNGSSSETEIDHIAQSCRLPGLYPEGIFTHFAVSDESGEDNRSYTLKQFSVFMHVISVLEKDYGITFKLRHCANSGAVVSYPETALDMVRPGLLLYGYGDTSGRLGLKPCMRLYTTVSAIKYYEAGTSISYGRRYVTERYSRIGVLAAGYADGLPRTASGKCSFFTPRGIAPQVGTICMDMCMADLTDLGPVEVGTEVELFGEHADLCALAAAAGTIPYEILCDVTKRVPRKYR